MSTLKKMYAVNLIEIIIIAVYTSCKMQAFQWTALFFAVNERRPEVLDYLLRSGRVDVNHVDDVRSYIPAECYFTCMQY